MQGAALMELSPAGKRANTGAITVVTGALRERQGILTWAGTSLRR